MVGHVSVRLTQSMLCTICMFSLWLARVGAFMNGAPANSCRDPSTFHTRKLNSTHEGIIMPQKMATNPYLIDVDQISYGPGQTVSVTLSTNDPETPFKGFFIQAVQGNIDIRDIRRQAFGKFENVSTASRPTPCQAIDNMERGGITHTDNSTKTSVTVRWVAPLDYDPGTIQFLATGVYNYDVYWTDIRSPIVTSAGYNAKTTKTVRDQQTPTGTWFRWLQLLRQQQLQRLAANQSGEIKEKTSPSTLQ